MATYMLREPGMCRAGKKPSACTDVIPLVPLPYLDHWRLNIRLALEYCICGPARRAWNTRVYRRAWRGTYRSLWVDLGFGLEFRFGGLQDSFSLARMPPCVCRKTWFSNEIMERLV